MGKYSFTYYIAYAVLPLPSFEFYLLASNSQTLRMSKTLYCSLCGVDSQSFICNIARPTGAKPLICIIIACGASFNIWIFAVTSGLCLICLSITFGWYLFCLSITFRGREVTCQAMMGCMWVYIIIIMKTVICLIILTPNPRFYQVNSPNEIAGWDGVIALLKRAMYIDINLRRKVDDGDFAS